MRELAAQEARGARQRRDRLVAVLASGEMREVHRGVRRSADTSTR